MSEYSQKERVGYFCLGIGVLLISAIFCLMPSSQETMKKNAVKRFPPNVDVVETLSDHWYIVMWRGKSYLYYCDYNGTPTVMIPAEDYQIERK